MNESQNNLLDDIQEIVEQSRSQVAVTANAVLTNMYWKIGERINKELLNDGRATYGKEIVSQVATKLQKQE